MKMGNTKRQRAINQDNLRKADLNYEKEYSP